MWGSEGHCHLTWTAVSGIPSTAALSASGTVEIGPHKVKKTMASKETKY